MGARRPPSIVRHRRRSENSNGLRLIPLGTLRHLELDVLTLLERLVTRAFDGRVVHEKVRAAFTGDEPVALLGVEPLDGTGRHEPIPLACLRGPAIAPYPLDGRDGNTPLPSSRWHGTSAPSPNSRRSSSGCGASWARR